MYIYFSLSLSSHRNFLHSFLLLIGPYQAHEGLIGTLRVLCKVVGAQSGLSQDVP